MNDKLTRLWATKNKNDEWWSSFVTAPLAIALNYIVVDFKWLTPNLLTLFSFVVAILAAALIIAGGTVNFISAAVLIHISHILDCMDGQMARYRNTPSLAGCYFDKLTDQLQVILWFGAIGYAAYVQSQDVVPVFLAFIGVSFYLLRGYAKYVAIYTEVADDNQYLQKIAEKDAELKREDTAGPGYGFLANMKWFVVEQRKIINVDEGVFIFMLSLGLVLNSLTPMLWLFAISQIIHGLMRSWMRGVNITSNSSQIISK
ncbi:MAG: CDP-alcohol phosphatidyltransferase family protein [Gammaproteobacteria bacterium]|nr:CDP-alcohol phosphatidyltransferase family protein [Gammaproteobacteria bacterium]